MKEPGQLAYETAFRASSLMDYGPWSTLDDEERDAWARIESAIRADERAKVIEECARALVHKFNDEWTFSIVGNFTHKTKKEAVAAAIRALGEEKSK